MPTKRTRGLFGILLAFGLMTDDVRAQQIPNQSIDCSIYLVDGPLQPSLVAVEHTFVADVTTSGIPDGSSLRSMITFSNNTQGIRYTYSKLSETVENNDATFPFTNVVPPGNQGDVLTVSLSTNLSTNPTVSGHDNQTYNYGG